MAFWNTDKIRAECHDCISPFRQERAKGCAYELGVGTEAFTTSDDGTKTRLEIGERVRISPGQFGLLVTEEIVTVPKHAIAFISIRAGIKFQGLVNVSGFHVDPGFVGHLKFAVYNAGSRAIVLDQGQPVFMIWFADLSAETPDPYQSASRGANNISSEDIAKLIGDVASPAELQLQINELEKDISIKFSSAEQGRATTKTLLIALIGIVLTILLRSVIESGVGEASKRSPDHIAVIMFTGIAIIATAAVVAFFFIASRAPKK